MSELQKYKVVFEITIQLYDIHEPFSDIEGVTGEKRSQIVIKFYRQKVIEEKLSKVYHVERKDWSKTLYSRLLGS